MSRTIGPWMRATSAAVSVRDSARVGTGCAKAGTNRAMHYLHAVRARPALLAKVRAAVFSQCTALFVPALAQPVPTRAESRTETAADVARIHGPMVRLTRPFSYLGLPVLTLPCGFDSAGMPVGFQLVGDSFAEAALVRIGMLYEDSAGWHRNVPGQAVTPHAVTPGGGNA